MDSSTAASWWNVWVNLSVAAFTAAAAIAAWLAYRRQRDELASRIEAIEREQHERGEAERRAQADAVCIWPSRSEVTVTPAGSRLSRPLVAFVLNGSYLPIVGVEVEFYLVPGVSRTVRRPAIGPGDTAAFDIPRDWTMDKETLGAVRGRVIFRDARRQLWQRDQSGELTLIESAQAVLEPASGEGPSA